MARSKRITIALSIEEYKILKEMANNSYSVYLSTFIYRILQDVVKGNLKIK